MTMRQFRLEPHGNGCHVYELGRDSRWRKIEVWPAEREARLNVEKRLAAAERYAQQHGGDPVPHVTEKVRRGRRHS